MDARTRTVVLLRPRIGLTLTICAGLILCGAQLAAQEERGLSVPLTATAFGLIPLSAGEVTGQVSFLVDDTDTISIDVHASLGGLSARVEGPGGEIIDPSTIGGLGGEVAVYEVPFGAEGLVLPGLEPGFHHRFDFPSLGPGSYTVRVDASAPLAQSGVALIQVQTGSPVVAGLLTTTPDVRLGDPAILVAALFEGDAPVAGATVVANVVLNQDPPGAPLQVVLVDDGAGVDNLAGDGLYSGSIVPSAAGDYSVAGEMTGTTTAGSPFRRDAGAELTVFSPRGSLALPLGDARVDDDGDGLYERLVVDVPVEINQESTHAVYVTLRTALGVELTGSRLVDLLPGSHLVEVEFSAERLRAAGEDGPFDIASVELVDLGDTRVELSASLSDAGQTSAYPLAEWQRPTILFGAATDMAEDLDGDTLFDELRVSLDVEVPLGGEWLWNAVLSDPEGRPIGDANGSGTLLAGANTIDLVFEGIEVGQHGRDGPYTVTDLLLGLTRAEPLSRVGTDVATTQAYLYTQFAGAGTRTTVPDVTGLTEAAAEAALIGAGLTVFAVDSARDATVPAGEVIAQTPAPGAEVGDGYGVAIVVSDGPSLIPLPELTGVSQQGAETLFAVLGLTLGTVTRVDSIEPTGTIIGQSPPPGALLAAGSTVDLTISLAPSEVPNLVGLQQVDAEALLTELDLALGTVTSTLSDTVPEGAVVAQNIVPGSLVPFGTAVDLLVSLGLPTVPDVVGLEQTAATAAILAAGLSTQASGVPSDTVPVDFVIGQSPAPGSRVPIASAVALAVSTGPDAVVPDLTGLSQSAAEAVLAAEGLVVGAITRVPSETIPVDHVVDQSPAPGTDTVAGSAVDLALSDGAPGVGTVPNVVGLTQTEAEAALIAAGFTVGTVYPFPSTTIPAGVVTGQLPLGSSIEPLGTAVDLGVSSGLPDYPVLQIAETAPASALEGAELGYVLSFHNIGGAEGTNVVVSDTLPTGMTFRSASDGGTYDSPTRTVTWAVGTLGAGESGQVTLRVSTPCGVASVTSSNYRISATGTPQTFGPAVSTTLVSNPTDALLVAVESVPEVAPPLPPGTLVTHTIHLTNTVDQARDGLRVPLNVGSGIRFESVVDAAGGSVAMSSDTSWTWTGPLGPSATADIVVTSRVEDCVPGFVADVGLNSPVSVFNACAPTFAGEAATEQFSVLHPIQATLVGTNLSPPETTPGLTGPPVQVALAGQEIELLVTLVSTLPEAQDGVLVTLPIPIGLDPVGDPPFSDPLDPALSYEPGTRTVSFSGDLAGFEMRRFGVLVTPAAEACRANLQLAGDIGSCTGAIGVGHTILKADPRAAPHLVGLDSHSGLWSFVPGVDTAPQSLLCPSNEVLTGVASGPQADLYVAGLPSFRFHRVLGELEFVPDGSFGFEQLTPSDVAVDATGGSESAVFVGTDFASGSGVVVRYDPVTRESVLIAADSALNGISRVEIDPEGRIVAVAAAGLVRLDPSGALPLPPDGFETFDLTTTLSVAGQLPTPTGQYPRLLGEERDVDEDDVVSLTSTFYDDFGDPANVPYEYTTVVSLLSFDRATSGLSVVDEVLAASVYRIPGGYQPLPAFLVPLLDAEPSAMVVGPNADLYFATSFPGSLSVVHRSPSLSAEVLVPPADVVPGAADLAWVDPSTAPLVVDLSIDKAAPASVEVGQELTYTLTVDNPSADPASALVVTDTLPAGIGLVSIPAECGESGGVLTCNVVSLAAGNNLTLDIVATATEVGTLVNTAGVTSAEHDPDLRNNVSTATTEAVPPPNQPPAVALEGGDRTTVEGDLIAVRASFTDPDSSLHSAIIDWGDVSPSEPGRLTEAVGGGTVAGLHLYPDDGVYTVTVTVQDGEGDVGEGTLQVTVANADPIVVAGGDQTVLAGADLTLDPATFTDPGVLDTHTATIDWGDGSPVEAGAVTQGLGSGGVAGSHQYAGGGPYVVDVSVTDDDLGVGSDSLSVTVITAVCGNDTVELGEDCDLGTDNGQPGFCCDDTCHFEASSTVCRSATDLCDAAERCTGSSDTCPADALESDQHVCRPAATLCDVEERCDGIGTACPEDALAPADTACQVEVMDFEGLTDQAPPGDLYAGGAGLDFGVTFSANAVALVDSDAGGSGDIGGEPSPDTVICWLEGTSLVMDVAGGFTSGLTLFYAGVVDEYGDTEDGVVGQVLVYDGPSATGNMLAGPIDLELLPADGAPDPTGSLSPLVEVSQMFEGTAASVELLGPTGCALVFDDITLGAPLPVCDREDTCDGSGVCVDNGLYLTADDRHCRGDQGDTSDGAASCDLPEICDGSSLFCPADGFVDEGVECRASLGLCDPAERCTGAAPDCPADALAPVDTVCRVSLGACDPLERCTGDDPECPPDALEPDTTVCRDSAGACDVAESCTGSDAACPDDGFSTGDECRPAVGDCDVHEVCDGTSAECPDDAVQPTGTVCRDSAGVCDVAEECDGALTACPADTFDSTTECRPAASECDAAEVCDGSGPGCPTDLASPAMTPCGDPSITDCTLADTCDGAGTCLANDQVSGTDCGDSSVTDCTLADTCDGAGTCLVNDMPSGTACGSGDASDCDNPDTCDGGGACLSNLASDGTACTDDGVFCNGDETCLAGSCTSGGDPCSAVEACDEGGHVCTLLCGNGGLDGDEQCDDGNREDLDGCSHECTVELGWECDQIGAGTGSACQTECGDGLWAEGGEGCEDGNPDSGDGCSDLCQVEDGYTCFYDPEIGLHECDAICGDGLIVGFEQCDDANDGGGDGCLDCLVEDGYECVGEPSDCTPSVVCGDGSVGAGEECDDANADDGDGCSADCHVEDGYECDDAVPSACTPIVCGDGLVMGAEACDDGNDFASDGCSSVCEVEAGFSCDDSEPTVCQGLTDQPGDEGVEHRASGCCAQGTSSEPPAWFVLMAGLALVGSWRRRARGRRRQ